MPFKKLLSGYKDFHRDYFAEDSSLYDELVAKGQSPETLVISCCDSRSDPAILTNAKPGQLFVVRNVGAMVPPYKSDSQHHGTSAAIEFAVRTLKVRHTIVMGHSLCGGIQVLARREEMQEKYEFLTQWIEIGAPARDAIETELADKDPETRQTLLEQAVVLVSLKNLMTFPFVADAVQQGRLKLHGWYFDMKSGQMLTYNHQNGDFMPLAK